MVVASLVLGIVAVVLRFVPVIGIFIALVAGVLAIVLAVLGKKKQPEKKGMAIAGLVLGIIGAALGVIGLICWAALGGSLNIIERAVESIEESM